MQSELKAIYDGWKNSLQLQENAASQLSPPLLLSITQLYKIAKRRILFVGQETYGWSWTKNLQIQFPAYPTPYLYNDITTMLDFMKKADSVDALCWGYKEFNFACYQPQTKRSPFWQAFRELQKWPDSGLIWNNLSRCDYQNGSLQKAPSGLQTYLVDSQRDLFAKEIQVLQPSVCIFFTGPNYDGMLSKVFPQIQYVPIDSVPIRRLARVHDPRLPACSFRTYHPNYLSQGRHWDVLDKIRELVVSET